MAALPHVLEGEVAKAMLFAEELRSPALRKAFAFDAKAVRDCAKGCFDQLKISPESKWWVRETGRILREAQKELTAKVESYKREHGLQSEVQVPLEKLVKFAQDAFYTKGEMGRNPVDLLKHMLLNSRPSSDYTGLEIRTWEDKGRPDIPEAQRFYNRDNREARQRIIELAVEEAVLAGVIEDKSLRRRIVETLHPSARLEITVKPPQPGSKPAEFKKAVFEQADQMFGKKAGQRQS